MSVAVTSTDRKQTYSFSSNDPFLAFAPFSFRTLILLLHCHGIQIAQSQGLDLFLWATLSRVSNAPTCHTYLSTLFLLLLTSISNARPVDQTCSYAPLLPHPLPRSRSRLLVPKDQRSAVHISSIGHARSYAPRCPRPSRASVMISNTHNVLLVHTSSFSS